MEFGEECSQEKKKKTGVFNGTQATAGKPNSIKTRCRCLARVKNAGTRLETCGGTDGRVEIRGKREGESVNVLLARRCNVALFLWISRLLTLEVDIAR